MEKSTRKKVIIITAVLLVAGGITGYVLWKRNKDKKDAEAALLLNPIVDPATTTDYGSGTTTGSGGSSTGGGTKTSTTNVDVPPPTGAPSDLAKSFNDLKTALGSRAKNYGTYIIYSTTQQAMGLGAGTKKVIVKFTNGGRWALFLGELKAVNRVNEGAYYGSGKKIVVYTGKNKGLVVEGNNPINNLARAAV